MCLESENKLLMTAGALCLKSRLTGKCGSVRANEWELPRHVSEKTILLRTNYLRNEKGTEGEVAETICRCRGKYRKQSNEVLLVQSRDPGLKAPPYSDPHPLSSPETRLLFILTSLHHKTSFLNPYEASTKSRYRRRSEDIYWPFLQKLTGLTLPIPAWGLWRDAICSFFVRLFCHANLFDKEGSYCLPSTKMARCTVSELREYIPGMFCICSNLFSAAFWALCSLGIQRSCFKSNMLHFQPFFALKVQAVLRTETWSICRGTELLNSWVVASYWLKFRVQICAKWISEGACWL